MASGLGIEGVWVIAGNWSLGEVLGMRVGGWSGRERGRGL